MTRESRAPLIVAIALLLLPVLYVGSYFALVVPETNEAQRWQNLAEMGSTNYRAGGWVSDYCFWPLEQIDRKLRPGAWESHLYAPATWE